MRYIIPNSIISCHVVIFAGVSQAQKNLLLHSLRSDKDMAAFVSLIEGKVVEEDAMKRDVLNNMGAELPKERPLFISPTHFNLLKNHREDGRLGKYAQKLPFGYPIDNTTDDLLRSVVWRFNELIYISNVRSRLNT